MEKISKISFEVTGRCNMRCRYCFASDDSKDVLYNYDHKRIIDNLSEIGLDTVNLTGGEALLLPTLPSLITYIKEKGFFCALATNGILLDRDYLNGLSKNIDRVDLSLNSLNVDLNDFMRGKKLDLDFYKKCIYLINETGIKLRVNTLMSAVNKQEISEIGDFLEKTGAGEWRLLQFAPLRGMAAKNKELFSITASDFNSLQEQQLLDFPSIAIKGNSKFYYDNGVETGYSHIRPNGDVFTTKDGKEVYLGNPIRQLITYDYLQSVG